MLKNCPLFQYSEHIVLRSHNRSPSHSSCTVTEYFQRQNATYCSIEF